MAKPTLLCFDGMMGYAGPFSPLFDIKTPVDTNSMYENIRQVDCVLLTGGEDVHPSMYGDHCLQGTSYTLSRDHLEEVISRICIDLKKPILGICRGAQFLCAMAGGRLVQDVTGHGRTHDITTYDNQTLKMTSLHHQMMMPGKVKHTLLAWNTPLSAHYKCGNDLRASGEFAGDAVSESPYPGNIEPDTIYFEEIKGLGFQGHPEMLGRSDEDEATRKWVLETTEKFLITEQ